MVGQHSPLLEGTQEDATECKWEIATTTWTTSQTSCQLRTASNLVVNTLINQSKLWLATKLKWVQIIDWAISNTDSSHLNSKSSNRDNCKICATCTNTVMLLTTQTSPTAHTNHISQIIIRTTQEHQTTLQTLIQRKFSLKIETNYEAERCTTWEQVQLLQLDNNINRLAIKFKTTDKPITSWETKKRYQLRWAGRTKKGKHVLKRSFLTRILFNQIHSIECQTTRCIVSIMVCNFGEFHHRSRTKTMCPNCRILCQRPFSMLSWTSTTSVSKEGMSSINQRDLRQPSCVFVILRLQL